MGTLLSKVLQATISGHPHPSWLPFPKAAKRAKTALCGFWKVSPTARDAAPLAPPRLPLQGLSPPSGATGHSESLWQTSGAAKAFSSFDHFINTCVLMPTTWERLPGNRSGNTLWGVFWLDGGDTRNRQGSMGRREPGSRMAQFRASRGIQGPLWFVKTFLGKEELRGTGWKGAWCSDPSARGLGAPWGLPDPPSLPPGTARPWVCGEGQGRRQSEPTEDLKPQSNGKGRETPAPEALPASRRAP